MIAGATDLAVSGQGASEHILFSRATFVVL